MHVLVEKASRFVLDLFNENLPSSFLYHNYKHTQQVVENTKEISENYQINVKQKNTLLLAAWFHDTGYTQIYNGHEKKKRRHSNRLS